MRLLLMVLIVAMYGFPAAAEEPLKGSLCLSEPGTIMVARHCRSTEGTTFEVEATAEERVFGWISSDESSVAFGVAAAGTKTVELPVAPAVIKLEIRGSREREWPQTTVLTIGATEKPALWQIELSPTEVVQLREILMPTGTWDVRFKALRHAGTTRTSIKIVNALDLGIVTLQPLPQIRANVIDREGEFIRSAMMISDGREVLATSDNLGEILYEAPCAVETDCVLPKGFRIEYPGTPPAWFTITNRKHDFDVGTLRLAAGGTLQVEIDRKSVKTPLVVEVVADPTAQVPADSRRWSDDRWRRWHLRREASDLFVSPEFFPLIASATLTEDESSVTFDNLPEGQLRLIVRGREQGEYLSRFFHVTPEETHDIKLAIQPAQLTIEVSRYGKDLEGVQVEITQWDAPWHSNQLPPTDEAGKSTMTMWEKGKHSAHIVDRKLRAATLFDVAEQKEQNVSLSVVPASLSGRVVEAATEKPVPGVALLLEDVFYGHVPTPDALTDDDGRFEIKNAMTGPYRLEVRADGFLPTERGGAIAPGHNNLAPVRLGHGVPYHVNVVWDDGTPIPGAVYLEGTRLHGVHIANEEGNINFTRGVPELPIPFWIVPAEGSFARGERTFEQEITIRVQRPGEKLILNFEDEDEEPVNFAHVSLMWNSRMLSRETRLAIESIQNKKFASGAASRLALEGMPAGIYTFSAARSFAGNPWLPQHLWPPQTTVHYSGAGQTAKVAVPDRDSDH